MPGNSFAAVGDLLDVTQCEQVVQVRYFGSSATLISECISCNCFETSVSSAQLCQQCAVCVACMKVPKAGFQSGRHCQFSKYVLPYCFVSHQPAQFPIGTTKPTGFKQAADQTGESEEELGYELGKGHALQRVLKSEEQANVILFLFSCASASVTGVNLAADGGA